MDEWSRNDAERHIRDVLESAKTGRTQRIEDRDGVFEVRFVSSRFRETAGKVLSGGGPRED